MIKIAVDAMGGDNAPECTVLGAQLAVKKFPDIENKQATAWLPLGAAQFMIENIKDYIYKYNIAVCNELPNQVGVLTSCRENFDIAFERVCRENNYEL